MDENQIKYLFSLTPQQIVDWYKSKGLTLTWNWKDLWQQAHNQSFTVAKVMDLDILQSILDETNKIFESGITFEQFQKDLEPVLKKLGWWGKIKAGDVPGFDPASGIDPNTIVQLGSPFRLKTIFRVNSSVAYNAERYKSQLANKDSRPYWLYQQLQRQTKREDHAKWHNKVFRWNDPIWNIIYPPNGWFCMCSVRSLTEEEVKAMGLYVSNGSDFTTEDIPEEWSYNPGETAFEPSLKDYNKILAAAFKEEFNKVKNG